MTVVALPQFTSLTILDSSLFMIGKPSSASYTTIYAANHHTSVLSRLKYCPFALSVTVGDSWRIQNWRRLASRQEKGVRTVRGSVVTNDIPPYSVAFDNPSGMVRRSKTAEEERGDLESPFREFLGLFWVKERREMD
ncbi:hypothetical protein L218DRAFT_877590 [Marasmius fiardii PR-910]|nr:hypothetical protein L218DRAFT_877590 [Marasmius fiardii PR-910]